MFDANMRWLALGTKFWAKVQSCSPYGALYHAGIRSGDLVECTMLSNEHNNPRVMFHLKNGSNIVLRSNDDKGSEWITYEGNPDGTGFICEISRKQAMGE